jgi:glycosyltransferase involved in cell wall biosynthesis
MKVTLNSTIRPVGFDYALALEELGSLQMFVCAFPRRLSGALRIRLGKRVSFCDFLQTVFLVFHKITGSTRVSRALASWSKRRLDRATSHALKGADAVIFYSGAGLSSIRQCRKAGVLSVCQVHHTHVLEQEAVLRREASACGIPYTPIYSPGEVRRQLLEFEEADCILCPSGSVRESFAREGFPLAKLLVVQHGVDLSKGVENRQRPGREGPLRVLYVGQLHYRKGLRYLAEAIDAFPPNEVECRMVGPDFGLSGLAGVPGAGRLTCVGSKKGAELSREYADADVFVLPSLEDGFGLVVLEAMLVGLPVIITTAVGAKDFVDDGVEGWIVPPADPKALQDRIRWMRQHPVERQAMGRVAAERAKAAGGWTASAQRLVAQLSEKAKELKKRENTK